MTDKLFKRANVIKKQIKTCDDILGFENDKNVWFCNNEFSFMKKEIFDVVKKKQAELEREYSEL